MSSPAGRGWGLAALVLLLGSTSAPAVEIADLPTLQAVYTTSVRLPGRGVRGLHWRGDTLWILGTRNLGLGAPDSTYVTALVALDTDGAADTLVVERDGYESGLTSDGRFLWSGGSLIGERQGLYQLSPQTGEVLLTLPAPGYHPAGVAWDGTYLWQVDADARKLYRIESEEGKVSRKVSSPGFYPTGLAYDGFHFWCADASTGRLYRLKGHNGRPDGVVSQEVYYKPGEFVSLTWDGRALWTVSAADTLAQRLELAR